MPNEEWQRQQELLKDIREAMRSHLPNPEALGLQAAASAALFAAWPYVEAAYRRGEMAGSSRAGHRLVAENERLRRQIPNQRKEGE